MPVTPSVYPWLYPAPPTWAGYVQSLIPDIYANGKNLDAYLIMVKPFLELDNQAALMYAGLINISMATGPSLALWGAKYGEYQDTLTEDEFRRIVRAWRILDATKGQTTQAVWSIWIALTDAVESDYFPIGAASADLRALVDYTPSEVFLARAANVLRQAIAPGYYADAILYTTASAYFDQAPGWDEGEWAFQLPL